MISRGTAEFWQLYIRLPLDIRDAARRAYEKFEENPAHPSLHLERLAFQRNVWSVRVTLNYRAVAIREGDSWVWFWIGNHRDFDRQFPL